MGPSNIYLKSGVETLGNGVKYVPVETLEEDAKFAQISGVFITDFEHILDLFLVFLLFTMNREMFVRNFFFV